MFTATYYVANRFGSMCEKQRQFGGNLEARQVRVIMDKFLQGQKAKGVAVYPQFDLTREKELAA